MFNSIPGLSLLMADSDEQPVALSTGMKSLDNQLQGNGLYGGTVVTILAPPNSTSEHLLYNMIGDRDTFYLSTARSTDSIKDTLEIINPDRDSLDIEFIEEFPPTAEAQQQLEDADLPEQGSIVVDPINFFERDDPGSYREFLQEFTKAVKETESIGFLHANVEQSDPMLRWLTLQMSDAIFKIKHRETNKEVEDQLLIPKLYGLQTLDERSFKLPQSLIIDVGTKESIKA